MTVTGFNFDGSATDVYLMFGNSNPISHTDSATRIASFGGMVPVGSPASPLRAYSNGEIVVQNVFGAGFTWFSVYSISAGSLGQITLP